MIKTKDQLKKNIQSLLNEAELQKLKDMSLAIQILEDAKTMLPELILKQEKNSIENRTLNKKLQEILYYSRYGNILYDIEEYDAALTIYDAIVKDIPKNNKIYKAQGDCYRKLEKYEIAIKKYDFGLDIYEEDESGMISDKAALLNSRGLAYLGLEYYTKASIDFDNAILTMNKNPNPLYYCNKASVLYNMNLKEEALLNFKKAQELIQNTKSFKGLSKKNIDSINNTLEIFTIIDDLNRICLKKIDEFFIKRETKFINSFIKDLENANFTENKNQEGQALKTLKEEIVFIQENMPKLYEYYDGFLYTMMQTYQISVVINKETFVLDSTTISFKIGIQLLSYIPLIGNTLKKILQNAYEFKNETKIMNKAINVTKFATTYLDFQDLAQDSIMHFIKINFNEINNLKPELEILPRWAKQYKDVLKKYKLSEYDLYGSRNETNMQKFGAQQASLLIERYIANGIIYGDNPAISLKPKEKKDKIFTYLSKIFSEELTNNKNLINDSNKNNDKIDKNCYVFYNNIKYDNEILNHPNLLNHSIKIFGLKYIVNSYEKLDKQLIQEAIFDSNYDLLIAGLMSVYEPTEEVF